jgi:tRNA pseudouridine55 synthase
MLDLAIQSHLGEIDQVPPMYSALKKDGRRLYELARAGQEVDRPARKVRIHELRIKKFDPRRPVLYVRCSKGTYIRTLVETLAAEMGAVAHVAALRRLSVGPFEEQGMVSMALLQSLAGDQAALDRLLLPADTALMAFPAVHLDANEAFYLGNGHPVGHAGSSVVGLVRIYDENQRFLGIGEVLPDGRVAPKRLFTDV